MSRNKIQFSRRGQALNTSLTREILKLTQRPEVISFAGGIPAEQTFPLKALELACERLFAEAPQASLQYGPTEGLQPLRQWVADKHGVDVSTVLITTGSQQALDLLAKVFIDPGSKVLMEAPTYQGALQAFSLFEPKYAEIPSDAEGLRPDALTEALSADARFLYTIPNFHNPTGRRLSLERREQLISRAKAQGILLVEDNPYAELSYTGTPLPTLHSLYPEGVVYLGSFSKVLAPGLRVGYVLAPAPIHAKMVQAKQAADLHTSSFAQRVLYEVLKTGMLDGQIASIRDLYSKRCTAMLEALSRHMPTGVSWNQPEGGMFIWVELPPSIDARVLFDDAIVENVAFVPGAAFYATSPRQNTMRLAFVTVSPEKIEEGIARLGKVLARHL